MSAMFAWKMSMKDLLLLAAAAIVAGMMACASPQAPESSELPEDRLSALVVTSDGDETLVTLVGVHDAAPGVASHSDPWAISIDLGEVSTGSEMMPMAVYDGTVDQVSAASFTDDSGATSTRVEIALAVEATHEFVSNDDGLTLRVVSAGVALEESDRIETDIWDTAAEDALALVESIDPFESGLAPSRVSAAKPPAAATLLSSVRIHEVEAGVLVHLVADGMIGATEIFLLEDPARLVIDLPGLISEFEQDRLQVGSATVDTVRIGAHAGKVRVVMDGGSAAGGFEGKRIVPVADGMFVALGSSPALDDALAAAMDASEAESSSPIELASPAFDAGQEIESPIADESSWSVEIAQPDELRLDDAAPVADIAAAEEPEPVTVFGIEYETDFERGVERIAIVASGKSSYDWVAPDAETVVIRIPNARMAPGAEGNIAPRAGGPLSLIRAFEQPGIEPAEVRIVVKREPHLAPRVDRIGSNVFVEFAIPEALVPTSPAAGDLAMAPAEADGSVGTEVELDPTAPQMPTELAAIATPIDADPSMAHAPMMAGPMPAAPAPASLEPPAAIDVLREGGLIDGKEYRGRRISLDFKDVSIEDVLRLIAEVSDLNIISGDEVQGEVSIRLVDVPWDQALDVILLTKGLGFVRVGNVLRIAPADVLAQEEEVRLQERRAKEKLEDLVVKLIPINYGAVKDMEALVKRLLSSRGSVNTDERTNTLIIKDIASVIDESTALVAAIDTETPQVMIEAKIVEANLDFARELGSVWSVGQQQLVDGFDPSSAVRKDLGGEDFRFAPSNFRSLDQANNVSFLNNLTAQPTALFNLSAFLLDEKFNIDVQLQAAENTGNGKVVSSPRVVTLDNSEAQVEQGVSIPFQTFENGDAKLEFIDATLSLKVTPHITADKSIIMKIEVTRDAPDSTVQTATGSPAIAKNQAKTETLVKDGQTLVLGGIYTIDKSFRQSRVPYLHRIPLIGSAFKSKEVSDLRKELLIFVTPRIVVQPNADI